MVKKFPFFLLLISMAIFNGCGKGPSEESVPKPIAVFSFSNGGCEAPCTVDFVNESKNASHFMWTFGDNGFSTENSPSHSFHSEGVYKVLLVVRGAGGTDSTSRTLTIKKQLEDGS